MLTYDKKHNENYSIKGSIWNTFFQKKVSLCCLFLFTIFIQAQKNQSKDSVTFAAHYLNENKKNSGSIYITKDAFVFDPENTISTKKTIVNEEKNKVQNKKIVLGKKTHITIEKWLVLTNIVMSAAPDPTGGKGAWVRKWSKLLSYDFFRIYTQYLVLYSPPSARQEENKTLKTSLPTF